MQVFDFRSIAPGSFDSDRVIGSLNRVLPQLSIFARIFAGRTSESIDVALLLVIVVVVGYRSSASIVLPVFAGRALRNIPISRRRRRTRYVIINEHVDQ